MFDPLLHHAAALQCQCRPYPCSRRARAFSETRHQLLQPPRGNRKGRGAHSVPHSGVEQRRFAHTVWPLAAALFTPLGDVGRKQRESRRRTIRAQSHWHELCRVRRRRLRALEMFSFFLFSFSFFLLFFFFLLLFFVFLSSFSPSLLLSFSLLFLSFSLSFSLLLCPFLHHFSLFLFFSFFFLFFFFSFSFSRFSFLVAGELSTPGTSAFGWHGTSCGSWTSLSWRWEAKC